MCRREEAIFWVAVAVLVVGGLALSAVADDITKK
jgi:hypothetical protein